MLNVAMENVHKREPVQEVNVMVKQTVMVIPCHKQKTVMLGFVLIMMKLASMENQLLLHLLKMVEILEKQ